VNAAPSIGRQRLSHLAAVLLVAGLAILPGLGRATLWEPDEPRFAAATREMFERGNFVTPYLNGETRFEKPILLYWLQAPAFGLFGDTELAARVPSALAGIGTVLLLYLIGLRVASPRAALASALVLATMFRFVTLARIGLTDVPVLFFVVAALYGFIRTSQTDSRLALWCAWIAVGLGILTKGPIGLLSVAIWATYAVFTRDRELFARIRPMMGLSVALAVALPWYTVMIAEHRWVFVNFALGHEILQRFVSEASFAPTRGFFYYLKVVPGDAAPWSAVFITGAAWAVWRWPQLEHDTRQPLRLSIAWFVCVFLVFALPRSKLPHYVLPAYPAAALLSGVFVDRLAHTGGDALWWRVPMVVVALVSTVTAALTALFFDVVASDAPLRVRWLVPGALVIGAVAVACATWKRALGSAVYAVTGMLAVVFALIGQFVLPRVVEPFKPMPLLAHEAVRRSHPGAPLGFVGSYGLASVVYYAHRHVQPLGDDDSTVLFVTTNADALCVMPLSEFQRIAPRLQGIGVIAMAEEFNVRIERLLERQKTTGRVWVLVGRATSAPQPLVN
jgi:4-amino-4-deoxy-L-arabinose transferase-like glycosyltransferase